MSLLRVHNFAISLDGFGTGEGQSRGLHFGRAGDRLHQCMFAARWWARKRVAEHTPTESAGPQSAL